MLINGKYILGSEPSVSNGTIGIFAADDNQMYIKLSDGTVLPFISGSSSLALDSNYVRVDGSNGPYSEFIFNSGEGINSNGTLNIGNNSNIINIGGSGTLVNIFGTTSYISSTDLLVNDRVITLNSNGPTSSSLGVGFEIEENNSINGYFKTNSTREGFIFKAPGSTWSSTFNLSNLSSDSIYNLPNSSGTFALLSDLSSVRNGLTYSGNNIILGGSLIQSTSINTNPSTYTFQLGDTSALTNSYFSLGNNNIKLGLSPFFGNINAIEFNSTGNKMTYTNNITGGIVEFNLTGSGSKFRIKAGLNAGSYFAEFNTVSLTSDRSFTYPDSSGIISLTSDLSNYLPLIGGTISGNLILNNTVYHKSSTKIKPIISGSSSLSLDNSSTFYVYSGATSSIWTLPSILGNEDIVYFIKNRGATLSNVTLQTSGVDTIFNTSLVSSINIGSGESYILYNDGSYWNTL